MAVEEVGSGGGGAGDSTPPFPGTKSFVYFKSESKKLSQKFLHVNNM